MKKNTKPKATAVYIPPAAEQDAQIAAIDARAGWMDITPRPLGTPEQREALGWQKARELVSSAMSDYSVQQSPQALMLLGLLQDLFLDAEPGAWLADFDRITKRTVAKIRADLQHESSKQAKAWVQRQYKAERHSYSAKATFARVYAPRIGERFPDVKPPSTREIVERWLKGM